MDFLGNILSGKDLVNRDYVDKAIPTVPTKLSQFTDDVVSGKYLPLTGGNVASLTIGGNTAIHSGNIGIQSVAHATTTNRFKYIASSGDLNTVLAGGGLARTYSNYMSNIFTNAPSDARYGMVLQLSAASAGIESLSGQLAWDVNHASTTDTTRYLWWRAADTNVYTNSKWHQIAFTDSNVASATKLATARTIWGQSFDGTGNVTGNITLGKAIGANLGDTWTDNNGNTHPWYGLDFTHIGTWTTLSSYFGLVLKTASGSIYLNSSGNVGIGTTDDSGAKLNVNGNVTARSVDANNRHVIAENSRGKASIYVAASGNRGLFDFTKEQWLIYTDGTNTYIPSKPVTMSSTLSVTTHVVCQNFLTNSNRGIYKGSAYTSAMSANDIAFYADYFRFDCGSGFVKTMEIDENLVTVTGNLVVTGDTSNGSDVRFKDIIKDKTIKIEHIAKAPLFTFKWNDREDDNIHLGSSAQYWEKVCPWLVTGEDFKSLNYAVGAMGGVISLARHDLQQDKKIKAQGKEIKALKRKVKDLETKIRRMEYGN